MKRSATTALAALALAFTLFLTACGGGAPTGQTGGDLGEGSTAFALEIRLQDGTVEAFTVHTDETTVGAALLALDGFVKDSAGIIGTVNGHRLDWNIDHAYWAFYVGDAYANAGANDTPIQEGEVYAFVYTPAEG
ncbi:MAG: hypothetical protein LBS96_00715 [Oscillospiraceae bacterium]|nr:hypothetical protein [Oscillospiraceae bacterium]